jgi:E2F-associated phosphoprotein
MERIVPSGIPAIVSAGESDTNHNDSTTDNEDSNDDQEDDKLKFSDSDPLYGANLDDEDEAWVYNNLRSGVPEPVRIRRDGMLSSQLEMAKLLRPRDSDAVLSCPCCFAIVCMDCQRHEVHSNQYRAMFVMNICLQEKLVYDPHTKQLIEATMDIDDEASEVYQSVHCVQCKTQVAALDWKDEVYHFFGCLSSS